MRSQTILLKNGFADYEMDSEGSDEDENDKISSPHFIMHRDSQDFAKVTTSFAAFKYHVLPFGLTGGPASYQQFMNGNLFEYLNDFCQAYLDDNFIYSKTKREQREHVRKVLLKLREAALQVDINKCEFHVQKTKFLDRAIHKQDHQSDPARRSSPGTYFRLDRYSAFDR